MVELLFTFGKVWKLRGVRRRAHQPYMHNTSTTNSWKSGVNNCARMWTQDRTWQIYTCLYSRTGARWTLCRRRHTYHPWYLRASEYMWMFLRRVCTKAFASYGAVPKRRPECGAMPCANGDCQANGTFDGVQNNVLTLDARISGTAGNHLTSWWAHTTQISVRIK